MKSPELIELARQLLHSAEAGIEHDFGDAIDEWAANEGLQNGPGVDLHAYRHAVLNLQEALDRVIPGLKAGIAEYHAEIEMQKEACPGCGALPGDGITAGCYHEFGCGESRLMEASIHDLTMAGL